MFGNSNQVGDSNQVERWEATDVTVKTLPGLLPLVLACRVQLLLVQHLETAVKTRVARLYHPHGRPGWTLTPGFSPLAIVGIQGLDQCMGVLSRARTLSLTLSQLKRNKIFQRHRGSEKETHSLHCTCRILSCYVSWKQF